MSKFIIQKEWFSVEQCEANPKNLYIFGDNSKRYGNAGQAQIRFCNNSVGIATKYAPGTDKDDYFDDSIKALEIIEKDIKYIIQISDLYDCVVFPYDGLGTGLSDMQNRCPRLLNRMNRIIRKHFNIKFKEV